MLALGIFSLLSELFLQILGYILDSYILMNEIVNVYADNSSCIKPASASMTSSTTSIPAGVGDEGCVLAAGNHGFQFDYTLPSDLPSTFEGRWGEVKYVVKATLKRPCRFDIEREAALTVTAHLDLNDEPELSVSQCCSHSIPNRPTMSCYVYCGRPLSRRH